jgi:hypothetical protein
MQYADLKDANCKFRIFEELMTRGGSEKSSFLNESQEPIRTGWLRWMGELNQRKKHADLCGHGGA